jgi:hypothetical protein
LATRAGSEARKWLLDAALRIEPSQRENRLSEIFATVLSLDNGLASNLFAHHRIQLKLPSQEPVSFKVRTQRMLDEKSQRSIDLEIVADSGGKEVARLWCECKVKAREGVKQLDDQFVALKKSKPRRSRLVAVVRTHADRKKIEDRKDGRPDGFKVGIITWSEVAALVAGRGGELAKSGWQEKATAPRASQVVGSGVTPARRRRS